LKSSDPLITVKPFNKPQYTIANDYGLGIHMAKLVEQDIKDQLSANKKADRLMINKRAYR
jgi:hypothetical protein